MPVDTVEIPTRVMKSLTDHFPEINFQQNDQGRHLFRVVHTLDVLGFLKDLHNIHVKTHTTEITTEHTT